MRRQVLFLILLVACSGADEAAEVLQAAADEAREVVEAARPSLFARIGGAVVPTGRFYVEVLPHRDGIIEALVYDERGNVVDDAGALQVQVPGADGSSHPVTLTWDSDEGKYVGAYDGAIAASGSVAVQVSAGDESFRGSIGKLAVAPEAPQRGGTVVVAGDYTAELVAKPDGSVTAYVVDADGNPVSGDDTRVQVELEGSGATTPIALRWDPQVEAFVGRPEAQVQWTGGTIALSVEKGGSRRRTRVVRVAPVRTAAHGGEVVVAGNYVVEVVPADDGNLKAYVVDSSGAAIAEPAHTNVVVMVDHRPVALTWDASEGAYKGTIDTRLDATVTPIQVVVMGRGRRYWGGVHIRHAPRLRRWHERRVRARAELPSGSLPHPPAVRVDVAHPRFRVRPAVTRVDVRGPGGQVRVQGAAAMVSIMGPSVMANIGPGGGVRLRGPGVRGVTVGPMGGVAVRGPGGAVRVRAPGGRASVMVRAPAHPSGMASLRVRGPGGGISVMLGHGGMRRHGMGH